MRVSKHKDLPKVKDLRDPLQVEDGVLMPDKYGGFGMSWIPIVSLWGKVEPLMPSQTDEQWDFSQHSKVSRYCVWVRQEFTLKPSLRFQWRGGILVTRSAPLHVGRRYYLFLTESLHYIADIL